MSEILTNIFWAIVWLGVIVTSAFYIPFFIAWGWRKGQSKVTKTEYHIHQSGKERELEVTLGKENEND